MSDLESNLSFNYLYRDGGNYKRFGNVVFANPNSLPVELVERVINEVLIDEVFFYANKFGVPSLFFWNLNSEDPSWHEFESILRTGEIPNSDCKIEKFLGVILGKRKLSPPNPQGHQK